jgi:glycosyltransferase involved in cell wall biosynthesis
MLAGALSGIPYSFTIHGPDIFFEPHHWRIDEKARRAAFVACISDFCRSQLMCFAAPPDWPRFHIVHCGVEPGLYAPSLSAPSLSAPGDRSGYNLLFVGRLAGVKGVPLLLDAVARLRDRFPQMRLTLIGDGPERAALEARAQALRLAETVAFLGYRSQAEVAQALAATDLFVLPSFAEGVPVVLMEALAAEVPVVTTRIAGVPELVVDGENGTLVPPGNLDALTDAIAGLLEQPETRAAMGQAGRAKVCADHDVGKEAAWLSHLFQSYALGQPPARTRPEPQA